MSRTLEATQVDPHRVQPPDPGLDSHCRRVAAVAVEIANRLHLPVEAQEIIERAALLHHYPVALFEPEPLNRVMTDLCGADWQRRVPVRNGDLPADIRTIVKAIQQPSPRAVRDRATVVAEIVEVANSFVEQVEFLPMEYQTVDQILDGLRLVASEGQYAPDIVMAAASLPWARREELVDVVYRMPVFPVVALRALEPGPDEGVSAPALYELAVGDPALTASLLRVANSSLYSPPKRITTLRAAIQYIGLKAARKVLTASVVRPIFAPGAMTPLWKHSLAVAQLAERLALISGKVDPKEAFLGGLVHDVGRLAVEKLTGDTGAVRDRMTRERCEDTFVEKVICRSDHGDFGADILQRWNFPDTIVSAVRFHHQPELHPGEFASLLYLAEYWTGSEEDIPSAIRLKKALEWTRLSADLIHSADSHDGLLDSLIGGA